MRSWRKRVLVMISPPACHDVAIPDVDFDFSSHRTVRTIRRGDGSLGLVKINLLFHPNES